MSKLSELKELLNGLDESTIEAYIETTERRLKLLHAVKAMLDTDGEKKPRKRRGEPAAADEPADVPATLEAMECEFAGCDTVGSVSAKAAHLIQQHPDFEDQINELAKIRQASIKANRGERSNQPAMAS